MATDARRSDVAATTSAPRAVVTLWPPRWWRRCGRCSWIKRLRIVRQRKLKRKKEKEKGKGKKQKQLIFCLRGCKGMHTVVFKSFKARERMEGEDGRGRRSGTRENGFQVRIRTYVAHIHTRHNFGLRPDSARLNFFLAKSSSMLQFL